MASRHAGDVARVGGAGDKAGGGAIVPPPLYFRPGAESFDKLFAYAHDRSGQHFPAWAAFNRAVGTDGSVGIWHETYLVEPGKSECIYANMPRFGLAAATAHVKAEGRLAAAKDRLKDRLEDRLAV